MRQLLARNIAAAFLSGSAELADVVDRAVQAWGRRERWLRPFVRRVLSQAMPPAARTIEALTELIDADGGFQKAWGRWLRDLWPARRRVFWAPPSMTPSRWTVPPLATTSALAEWLGLSPAKLDWFADCRGLEADAAPGPLRHYTYRWIPKRSGRRRLLEVPKSRLKAFQRKVLHEILDRLPAHDVAHGFRTGRSVVTYAAPHCGRRFVLRFDLRHFFPSVPASRVHAVFAAAGYPREVARVLTGLCTNVVPAKVRQAGLDGSDRADAWDEVQRYRSPHLPQGAPTSPALANLCAYRLDCRLLGLARSLSASYTRYADDMAFSGDRDLERAAKRLRALVYQIALEEGFDVHLRKSRTMRQGVRQHLAGVVVNAHPNIRRAEFDILKATLHNCVRHGPAAQNRNGHRDFRAHLLGRIGHVAMLHPSRGQRLRSLFERIHWEGESSGG